MSQFKDEVMIALRFFADTLNSRTASLMLTKEEEAAAKKIAQALEFNDRCPPEYLQQLELQAKYEFADELVNVDPLTTFDVIDAEGGTWVRAWVFLEDPLEEDGD